MPTKPSLWHFLKAVTKSRCSHTYQLEQEWPPIVVQKENCFGVFNVHEQLIFHPIFDPSKTFRFDFFQVSNLFQSGESFSRENRHQPNFESI